MELVAVVLFGIVLFAHSWSLLKWTNPKLPGMIAGTVAIALLLLMAFKPVGVRYGGSGEAAALCILLPTVYAASLAGVGLWGFDPRALGFYSAFNAVGQLLLALYFGGMNPSGMVVVPGGVAIHLILLVAFGLLAVHLIMPAPATQRLTGWFLLISSLVITLLAFLGVLGLA